MPAGGCTCPRGCTCREGLGVVYLPGGCTCPGGCTWLWGVPGSGLYLLRGVPARWGVPARGGVPVRGCTCLGGVPAKGGTCPGTPDPVNRMTDRCKNITLPQTSFAGGNNMPSIIHA